jgi:hypothetical protein
VSDTTICKQTQHNMCWTPPYVNKHNTTCATHVVLCLFTYGGVQHMLCCVCLRMVVFDTCCVVFVYAWWCSTHVVLCLFAYGGVQHTLCCVCLRMVVSDTQHVLDTTMRKQTQHHMCRIPPYVNKHNTTCGEHHQW